MELQIEDTIELPNGNVELKVNMDDEMVKFLINYAIIDILESKLDRVKGLYDE